MMVQHAVWVGYVRTYVYAELGQGWSSSDLMVTPNILLTTAVQIQSSIRANQLCSRAYA